MSVPWPRLFLLFTVLCLGLVAAPVADAGGFIIRVGPGNKDFPLALPLPQTPLGDRNGQAQELWEVIQRDLEMTGYFRLVGPDAVIEKNRGVEPNTFSFADWRVLRVAGLAKTRLQLVGDRLQADVFIYDVNGGSKLSGKRLIGPEADLRYLGHRIANEILETLTGNEGFFDARIAAVGTGTGNKEVYLMDIDGKGLRRVTRNGSINLSPAWSPTGENIAWTSFKNGNADVFAKNLATGRTWVLSSQPQFDSAAAWSPDGTKVAVTRGAGWGSEIYILDARTGKLLKQVTSGGGINTAPDWSPDGSRIAFCSERSGGSHIFVYDLASGAIQRVSREGSFNTDPVFSPDGTQLAYVGRDGNFDIFVINLAENQTVRITEHMGTNMDPSWSPKGQYVLFSSTRGGRGRIWLSTADGRHQVPVTDSGGWTQPAWSPARR